MSKEEQLIKMINVTYSNYCYHRNRKDIPKDTSDLTELARRLEDMEFTANHARNDLVKYHALQKALVDILPAFH